MKDTGNSNLHRHLHTIHVQEYDDQVTKNKWAYKLSTQVNSVSMHNTVRKVRNQELPSFSLAVFLEHLIRFIVADDQVCLIHFVTLAVSHVSSWSTSSNVLSSKFFVWSSVRCSSMPTSLITIRWGKLLSITGGCRLKACSWTFPWVNHHFGPFY